MNSGLRRRYAAVVVAVALAAACKTNPVASLAGTATLLSVAPAAFSDTVGQITNITVRALDGSFTALPATISATSSAPGVATVGPGVGIESDPTGTTSFFGVTGVAAGTAYIRFTAQGVRDSAKVTVP